MGPGRQIDALLHPLTHVPHSTALHCTRSVPPPSREPVAYFTSVVFMIMAYGYFMSAGKEYSYEDLNRRLVNRYKKMYLTR